MWSIEVASKFTNVFSRLLFDTKEEAEAQIAKIKPLLGQDKYDIKKNGETLTVQLTDKYGTVDIVCENVITVRCYDLDAWNDTAVAADIAISLRRKEAGV